MSDKEATTDPVEDPEETYESWTKEQLHDELANRGLTVSGTKDEQISRLEEDDLGATAEVEAVEEDVEETEAEAAPEPDAAPVPRVPPEGPTLTVEQETQLGRLQADFPHEYVTVEWDESGEIPAFVTPDGEKVKAD